MITTSGSKLSNYGSVIDPAAKADLKRLNHLQLLQVPNRKKGDGMTATQRTKELLKETFPSMWVRWHLMHHPKSAEQELLYLDRIVPEGAVTVDGGANCCLFTPNLAPLSTKPYAFQPPPQQ